MVHVDILPIVQLLEEGLLAETSRLHHLLCVVFTLFVFIIFYLNIKKVALDNIVRAHTRSGLYLLSILI